MPAAKRNTCTACRGAKLRCDRAAPSCGRCHELGIACIEQVRSQGRPPKARLVEPTRPEFPPKAGGADGGASVGSGAGEAAAAPHKRPHEGSSRSRNRPSEYPVRALASLLYKGFGAFRAAGRVQTEKATSILRAWNLVSETHGKDASYGAFNQVVRGLGLDHHAAIFVQQRPPGCSGKRVPGRQLEEPATPATAARLPPALREMAVGEDAAAYYVLEDGHVQLGVNAEFEARLMSAPEACAFLGKQAVLPVFFWGCLFTAASQEILYRHLSQALFCHPTPVGDITLLLECVDRQGQPFFGVTTIRAAVDGEGAYAACALSIAPLPPSPINPTPHVVGTCLLPKPQPPRPRAPSPAVKEEPCFPLLHAYRPPQAATKAERGAEEEDGPFTCSLKAACAGGGGGDWGYSSSNWEGSAPSDDTKPRRSRRPSARAREAEAAAVAAATSGEEDEDCASVVSSVSSGSAGERGGGGGGGSARKKRRRVVRPQRPPVVVPFKPEDSLVQFPYLHRAPDDGHNHHAHAVHPAHPGGYESVQTGDTSSEDGAADAKEEDEAEGEEEGPFHTAAGAAPRPPLLRRATSSGNGGSGSYGGYGSYGSYRGARRTVEDCQSALLSLAATSSAVGAARVVAPPSPVGLPKPVLPPATTTAGHGGGDEDDFGGYNELLSLDVDWDLLAPSPLLWIDGFVGRAQQPHPHPQPLAHMVKAEPAVEGGMMGYGLI